MRFEADQPVVFIHQRRLPFIIHDVERLEFFWCMQPVIHLPHYGLISRLEAISEKIASQSLLRQSALTLFRHLSHFHYTRRCCSVVASFPDDRNYWFYKRFWLVEKVLQKTELVIPIIISWKVMEWFHVTEFFPPPKYITLPPNIMKHVLSFVHYRDKFLSCSLVSTEFNTLVQSNVITIDGADG